jgi:hypothetical protein
MAKKKKNRTRKDKSEISRSKKIEWVSVLCWIRPPEGRRRSNSGRWLRKKVLLKIVQTTCGTQTGDFGNRW